MSSLVLLWPIPPGLMNSGNGHVHGFNLHTAAALCGQCVEFVCLLRIAAAGNDIPPLTRVLAGKTQSNAAVCSGN